MSAPEAKKQKTEGEKTVLVTGSAGLVGSSVVEYFAEKGWKIVGLDNYHRAVFFGPAGDTSSSAKRLEEKLSDKYVHHVIDIRDRDAILKLVEELKPDAIVHCAAQPSHDKAADIPFLDFEVNAVGTMNMLEATRRSCPKTPFLFMSTNKVYGDRPNTIPLKEKEERWVYEDENLVGIDENMSIDQSTHSLFGSSKVAADVMVQEYGRYFGMYTCCLRAGCMTGAAHAGVEMHGFLNYLVTCAVLGKPYTIYGYKGKQVRDNIDGRDVASFIYLWCQDPKGHSAIYNMGGGAENSCSMLEAIRITEEVTGHKLKYTYSDQNRKGDHICYISDLSLMKKDYPEWKIEHDLKKIISDIAQNVEASKSTTA